MQKNMDDFDWLTVLFLLNIYILYIYIFIYGCSVYLVKENDYDLATD